MQIWETWSLTVYIEDILASFWCNIWRFGIIWVFSIHIYLKITNNINKFENNEQLLFINSKYTKLEQEINNVSSIEIKNIDLPFYKYNITSNNNILKFINCIINYNDNKTIN